MTMLGSRARIGYCSPPFVTETFPLEFYMMAPQGVSLLITTLEIRTRTKEEVAASHERSSSSDGSRLLSMPVSVMDISSSSQRVRKLVPRP